MADKKNKEVLVVEDDYFLARVLKNSLAKEGVDVFIAENGENALKYLENNVPNAVVLDLMLPGISGFDFHEEMKKNEKLKNIPIIVNTNLRSADDKGNKNNLEVNEYLVKKDVRIGDVVKKVMSYL